MGHAEAQSRASHLAPESKGLIALVVILLVVIITGIVFSALSITVLTLLAVVVLIASLWLARGLRLHTGPAGHRLSDRKHKETDYWNYGDE